VGANYWQAMNMSALQINSTFNFLSSIGITSFKIMGTSQGPYEPYRMYPALEPNKSAQFNREYILNLDNLFNKTSIFDNDTDNMRIVITINNFWHWTGGISQYVNWFCNNTKIPYPNDHDNATFIEYATQFYTCQRAKIEFQNLFTRLANQVNKLSGRPYKEDQNILAWEIAFDPIPGKNTKELLNWIKDIAKYIKIVDKNHLVTVGCSGIENVENYRELHEIEEIDYLTFYIFPDKWGWIDFSKPLDMNYLKLRTTQYLSKILDISRVVRKPLVLNGFYLPRDGPNPYFPNSTTKNRDSYYSWLLEILYGYAKEKLIAGIYFWGWSGNNFPEKPGQVWDISSTMIGDIPSEKQGLYAIYENDTSTLEIIGKYAILMRDLSESGPIPSYVWLIFIIAGGSFFAIIIIFIIVSCRAVPIKKEEEKKIHEEEKEIFEVHEKSQ